MNNKLLLTTLLVFCIWGGLLRAQSFVFEKITTREGLSQNDVVSIYQDKQGFLWIGTFDGLNRYDGYNFKTYRYNPNDPNGMSSNLVYSIDEDRDGNLWIGTSDQGVCRFNLKTETFTAFKNTDERPRLFQSNQIMRVAALKNGDVWVGSNAGIDVIKFDREGNFKVEPMYIREFASDPLLGISVIKEDEYGNVWVGTRKGLLVFQPGKGYQRLKWRFSQGSIKALSLQGNRIYVGLESGVYQLFPDDRMRTATDKKISDVSVNCMLITRSNMLFIGNDYGLYVVPNLDYSGEGFPEHLHFTEGWEANNLNSSIIRTLYEDNSGIVWIGTNGGGLNKYNPKQKKFRHFGKTRQDGSISYNKIRAIYQDSRKNIWIGTEGGGINFLSHTKGKAYDSGWESFPINGSSGQNYVYSIVEVPPKNKQDVEVIAGTGYPSVVARFRVSNDRPVQVHKGEEFRAIHNSPFAFLYDHSGNLWVGTYGQANGLIRYVKTDTGMVRTDLRASNQPGSLSSNNIRSIHQDPRGNIWVGTDKGLNLLLPEQQLKDNPEFVVFTHNANVPGSISHDYILPIFSSKDGTVWVGTMGGGLNRVIYNDNPHRITFEAITTDDGLPNNVIKGILEDDYGFLWISSNKGLTRFDVDDRLFVNYGISDGLQDYEFGELACCKLDDGEMLFGGVNGFNAFYPKDIVSDMTAPKLALTDFQILNRSVRPGEKVNGRVVLDKVINHMKKVKLKYSENSFAIYFASLHFSAPAKNYYKYKLEGFDKEWIRKDATDRIAKYTNLPPGRYVFKVIASNNDGIWTDEPKVLEIIITPPWYFSPLAWVVYVLLFIGALLFFQRYSVIRIKQKNELLMEHFEKEKIQELSQMKLRFFTNISHEFRTPLTLIIGPLEKLLKEGKNLSEEKILASYRIMYRNATVLLRLINQLIDFRKFEQGKMKLHVREQNIVPFLKEIFNSFKELAEQKNIDYRFVSDREEIWLWADEDKLERIMYNLLSNAFKYTQEGGHIEVIVEEDDKDVVILVADTGVGIPKEMQKHIFERFYQAERIENRKVGSTGIGLSFIKGLVEMHKGDITFESEEGKGTTFKVKLKKGAEHFERRELTTAENVPVKEVADMSYLELVKVEGAKEAGAQRGKKKNKLLIVEDNFELKSYLESSFSEWYEVFTAGNGAEALELVGDVEPDVVVSDIMMPVMNGFQLCRRLKESEETSHIPVILLTAKTTDENRIKGYEQGADGYIAKPFSFEVLEARVRNLLEARERLRDKLRTTVSVEPSEVTTTSMDEKFLKRILQIIEENISNSDFTVERLSLEYGMSQIALNKKLKGLTGMTAKAFIRSIRLKRAAQLFATGNYSVTDVTYEVGFSDLKYFRTCFKEEFGMAPSEYIKAHKSKN